MQKNQPRRHRPPTTVPTKREAHDAELLDESDLLMDEIDAILEEHGVRQRFRQRGGQ